MNLGIVMGAALGLGGVAASLFAQRRLEPVLVARHPAVTPCTRICAPGVRP